MQPQTFENTKSRFSPQTFPRRYLILCKKKNFTRVWKLFFPRPLWMLQHQQQLPGVFDGVWHFNTNKQRHWKHFSVENMLLFYFGESFASMLQLPFNLFFWFVVSIKCNRREVCAINFKGFWMGLHFPLLPCTQNKDLTRGRSRSFCYKEFQFLCFWPCEPLLSQLVFFYSSHAPYA